MTTKKLIWFNNISFEAGLAQRRAADYGNQKVHRVSSLVAEPPISPNVGLPSVKASGFERGFVQEFQNFHTTCCTRIKYNNTHIYISILFLREKTLININSSLI